MPDYKPRFSNKKPFQKRNFGRDEGSKELFSADCNKCGKTAQVPFRPNGRKPIYCSDCFVKDDAPQRPSYDRPRREFSPRPSFSAAPREDRSMAEVKRELEAVNQNLERLISLMTPKIVVAAAPKASATVKKAAKKAVKKKK